MIEVLQNGINADTIIFIFAFLLAIMLSITIHEYAHGYVAYKQGDDTAKLSGRLTLNPIKHIDALGFLSLIIFGFGWAKPVPINPLKFKEYKKGILLTSVAGIVANIFLSFFSCGLYVLFFKLNLQISAGFWGVVINFAKVFFSLMTTINIALAIFNLIPIAPLDGFKLLCGFSKTRNKTLEFIERYGSFLLIGVLILLNITNALGYIQMFILEPFINFWEWVI